MDAQSNSLKQDSSDRPSDTPNPSSKPRRMSVAQKALAPFAHLRSIQKQYGPGSVEAFGAQQQAEQTVQRPSSTKDQDNVTAKAQKDTSSSSQTPGAQKPQAKHLTRFEAEYNARRLAAAIEGPKFDSLLSQARNQTQSCSAVHENPAPAQTQNTCLLTIQTSNQERRIEAKEGPSSSNLVVQHSVSTQNQNDLKAQTQKDTSRSSDTYKTKTVPDVQRKIKSWELSMAKTQFDEWNDIPNTWNLALEMEFERRLQDFTKSQGVELQDVVFTPIRFCKSQTDAQAHYEALLAEFRNTYKTRQAAAVAQTKVDHQVQAPKQASSQAQNPIQSSPKMPKNPTASAQDQALPQDPAQTQSISKKNEEPAPAQTQDTCQLKTQVSNQKGQVEVKKETASSNLPMRCSESQNSTQDNISDQTQKDTSQHPAETQEAPQAQTPVQAPIKTKTPLRAKSQTPHSKLAYVQATVKLNELALAKVQVDYYNECNPEYWARIEKNFLKRIEGIAKSHGVDPRDVVINFVPLAKSQAEAQAQYKTLYDMAREAGHSEIVAEHTASEITSQKGCLTQDNLLNEIALLKMELAETKGSQDQALKEFEAKSEKTRLEHLKQVDYLQKRIKMEQVENQLLSSKLSEEQSTSEHLRASLEESEKEVERLRKVLKAKAGQKVRVLLPLETAQLPDKSTPEAKKTVPSDVSQIIALNKEMADEQAKANAQRHAEVLAAIQTTVQESFKAAAKEKAKAEADEKAKIEAKAQIYARAYVKAKTEAKAKSRAEAEAQSSKNRAQSNPLSCPQSSSCTETWPKTQTEVQVKNLQKVIDQLIKSYRNSSEKHQEQIRCLEYDIQKLTEKTGYEIKNLKKEVAEKDDKILELQKELWKVIDERQEARLDAEKLAMQLCTNNW
ncbi:unnamed protein product [Caenorhabditis brenneri]